MDTLLKGMRRSSRLLILVVVQILFLLGLSGSYYAAGWWGQEIRLQTVPIDPTDLFYGDYVILNYEISALDPELWKEEGDLPDSGDIIYVVVKPDSGGIYRPLGAYTHKPGVDGEAVVLKGRVQYSWESQINVDYGLERFYVPEGTGKELEEYVGDTVVRVKVAPWGQRQITGIEQ